MSTGEARREGDVKRQRMSVQRVSERELVVTRLVDAPPRLVFKAWTDAVLFRRWWVPESFGLELLSCELDVRVGGGYRLVFRHPAAPEPMAFYGKYLEVVALGSVDPSAVPEIVAVDGATVTVDGTSGRITVEASA